MLRTSVLAVLIACGLLIVGAGAKHARTRAKVRRGIPAHDYQVAKYSAKRRAVSSQAIGIPAPIVPPRPLIGGNTSLIAAGLNQAIQAGTAELQRVSEEISNQQLKSLLSQASNMLGEVEPRQILDSQDVDDAEVRRRLVEKLQELKPSPEDFEAMLTAANITDERVKGLLSSTINILTSDQALALPLQPATPSATVGLQTFSGKMFQFVESPVLRIGHCSISELSIQIHETGRWSVSLRADQNPANGPASLDERDVTTAEPAQTFTEHLQRNQFFVRAYCYANYGGGRRLGPLGGPVMIPLDIEPFWVQKGVSLPRVVTANSRRIRELFQQIDRAEIEFYYRTN